MRKFAPAIICLVVIFCITPAFAKSNLTVTKAFRSLLKSGNIVTRSATLDAQLDRVKTFYATRNNKPIWVRDSGPKGKAKALVAELRTSAVHGLSPEFYHFTEINSLMSSKVPDELARLELLLSGALVEFGGDLMNGRVGPAINGSMNAVEPFDLKADVYIQEAEATGNLRRFMGGLLQSDKRYVRLITKMVEFIKLQKSGIWPKIQAEGKAIPVGRSDPRMRDVRMLMALGGDLPINKMNDGIKHDKFTVAAVKKFQQRHGLQQNGIVDKQTLLQMAIAPSERVKQIKINLERRRWQVRSVADDHLHINMVNGSMRLMRNGKVAGRYSLLNHAKFKNLPTFLGDLILVEQTIKNNIRPEISISATNSAGLNPMEIIDVFKLDDADAFIMALTQSNNHKTGDTIKLSKPLPIFMTYVTAWATRDGRINFYPDIFKRDALLFEQLTSAN